MSKRAEFVYTTHRMFKHGDAWSGVWVLCDVIDDRCEFLEVVDSIRSGDYESLVPCSAEVWICDTGEINSFKVVANYFPDEESKRLSMERYREPAK